MEIDETAEAAAIRELQEETGIILEETDIFQVGAYTTVDRDPRERVITIAYLAEIDKPVAVKGTDDAVTSAGYDDIGLMFANHFRGTDGGIYLADTTFLYDNAVAVEQVLQLLQFLVHGNDNSDFHVV